MESLFSVSVTFLSSPACDKTGPFLQDIETLLFSVELSPKDDSLLFSLEDVWFCENEKEISITGSLLDEGKH